MMRRRAFVGGASALLAGCQGLLNECAELGQPGHPVDDDLSAEVWRGLDVQRVLDCHVHLAGLGADPRGDEPWTNPALTTPANPFAFAHFLLYANASCVLQQPERSNEAYVRRLTQGVREFPPGARFLLYALDGRYLGDGALDTEQTVMRVPNRYAMRIARRDPSRFAWAASIHPHRVDALQRLREVTRDGACALKWIPYFMDIDPASPRLDPFYDLLAKLGLPLIVHAGWQHPIAPSGNQEYGNPLRLRRALDRGVRVVVAHCATQGEMADIDRGRGMTMRPLFELFRRLIDDPAYRSLLWGDISGVIESGRPADFVGELLQHPRWTGRLLNGSDYPLPGVRYVVNTDDLVSRGLLEREFALRAGHFQAHNPLLFDFVLKRSMSWRGARFPRAVFECADVFGLRAI